VADRPTYPGTEEKSLPLSWITRADKNQWEMWIVIPGLSNSQKII